MKLENLDIILFKGKYPWYTPARIFENVIKYFTGSEYTHVGLVLKDTTWINPSLTGYYIWNSGTYKGGNAEDDNLVTLGVQLNPLYEYVSNYEGDVYVRRLDMKNRQLNLHQLYGIHKEIHSAQYNTKIIDWICAYFNVDREPYKTHRFWCSAFVSYVLYKMGFFSQLINWDIVRPSFFDDEDTGGFDFSLAKSIKYERIEKLNLLSFQSS